MQFISAFYKIRKEEWLGHVRPRDGKETWRSEEKDRRRRVEPGGGGGVRCRGAMKKTRSGRKISVLLVSFHVFLSNVSPWLSHIHYA